MMKHKKQSQAPILPLTIEEENNSLLEFEDKWTQTKL